MIYNIRSMQQYVKQKMQTRDFYCKEVNTKCKKLKLRGFVLETNNTPFQAVLIM